MKNKLVLTIVSLAAMVFLAWLFVSFKTSENRMLTCTVVKNPEYEAWGVETRQVFSKKIFLINNLPVEFQVPGIGIKIGYSISDVVGKGNWDTVIMIVDNRIELRRDY